MNGPAHRNLLFLLLAAMNLLTFSAVEAQEEKFDCPEDFDDTENIEETDPRCYD